MTHKLLLVRAVVVMALLAPALRASAGGLYLTDRGSRSLARGGAFVAGADDGQSLWYNPAGLRFTGGRQLHVDGTLSFFRASFQRVTRDDVNGPTQVVNADAAKLPIPTLAYTDDFGSERFSFGVAVMAPNAVMLSWPESVGTSETGVTIPGPTRYSLVSMKGSAIANLAAGLAYEPFEGLSIGAGVHVIPARFHAGVYLNACDYGVLCSHPEDPDYEAPAVIDLARSVTATGTFGLIYAMKHVRFGASVMLPYRVGGRARLRVSLPNAPLFGEGEECNSAEARASSKRCAQIVGNQADVGLDFPLVARGGVEVRPFPALRVEADVVYEGWSRQETFRVVPHGVSIRNALGIPLYEVGPISVPRQMRDVISYRFGVELQTPRLPVAARMGVVRENSAFRSRTLTPLTLDSDKLVIAFGGSLAVGKNLWLDAMYAHVFMRDPTVRDSIVYPANPLRPARPSAPASDPQPGLSAPEPVGNGHYAMEADIIGGGLRWNL